MRDLKIKKIFLNFSHGFSGRVSNIEIFTKICISGHNVKLIRCCPEYDVKLIIHPELERFDALLRSGLSSIINISISDVNWIRASLLVGDGGLGIRSAALLAPSAFLASVAGTRNLQSNILLFTTVEEDSWISHTRQIWAARYYNECWCLLFVCAVQ